VYAASLAQIARWWLVGLSILALLAILALLGCGAPAWGEAYLKSFHAGRRAYSAGRYQEAARHFEQASTLATRVKDRDEALFMQARMYEKLERWGEARASYDRLVRVSPKGPRSARAVYELAQITIAHGDSRKGWTLLRSAIERHPNHGSARGALSQWVREMVRRDGEEGLRRELVELLERVRRSELEQRVKYERALSLERSGKLEAAHDALVKLAREHPYPQGNLTDDAWMRASRISEQRGDAKQAIEDLRRMLSEREIAVGGSYERPRFPEAQMRIGELYRDRLGDLAAARRAFRATFENHETSILADDAMWHTALIALWLGDRDEACDVARELSDRVPLSRYRKCIHQLCPALKPIAGERPCPPYLRKQLNGTSPDE
jgi:tetratricopeptide (TPR) repeat protein